SVGARDVGVLGNAPDQSCDRLYFARRGRSRSGHERAVLVQLVGHPHLVQLLRGAFFPRILGNLRAADIPTAATPVVSHRARTLVAGAVVGTFHRNAAGIRGDGL